MKFWQLVFLFLLYKDVHTSRDQDSVSGYVTSLFIAHERLLVGKFDSVVTWCTSGSDSFNLLCSKVSISLDYRSWKFLHHTWSNKAYKLSYFTRSTVRRIMSIQNFKFFPRINNAASIAGKLHSHANRGSQSLMHV